MGGQGSGKRPEKYIEANSDDLARGKIGTLDEVGEHEGIEKVAENDFVETAELESFMNEILTIEVHPSAEEGSIEVIVPSVNGINQPIIRGRTQDVKRKYVEDLARCRITKYIQKIPDPSKPENIQMEERTVLTYPFAVIRDPSPNGRKWLKSILAQP